MRQCLLSKRNLPNFSLLKTRGRCCTLLPKKTMSNQRLIIWFIIAGN